MISNRRLTVEGFYLINVALLIAKVTSQYSFLALGDWGAASISEYKHNVYDVSNAV
jgi:hypothetical protein